MEYFFQTSKLPDGVGFSYFGGEHLFWLTLCLLLTVVSCLLYRKLGDKERSCWRKVIAMALIMDELFKQIPLLLSGNYSLGYLPLHLCNINIFMIAIHAYRPSLLVGNFLYTICIPGALSALLFPTWTRLPVMNFMYLHSFTLHILLVLYPTVLAVNGDIRPQIGQIPKCLALLMTLALVCNVLNGLWGTNFFFLRSVGKSNPLYWFQKNWGNHLLGFPVIIAAVLAVMYLPVEIFRRSHGHKKHRPGIA